MGHIIQIHGTSGSGKTTAMRNALAKLRRSNDKHLLGYSWTDKKTGKPKHKQHVLGEFYDEVVHEGMVLERYVFAVGDYSATCGGVDSLSSPGIADTLYNAIDNLAKSYDRTKVCMEGLIQLQPGRSIWLAEQGHNVTALVLNTPLEQCIANIKKRRAAAGNDKPLDEENTRIKFEAKARLIERLRGGGVGVLEMSSDEATQWILEAPFV
jgi:hypothetical protein